jgi:Holliday junction resolvase RusA-like endonuclease
MNALAKIIQSRRETDHVVLVFDAPPGVNNLFANVAGKGRVKTRAYRDWLETASWQVELQRPGHVSGSYRVNIGVRQATLRNDLDGLLKPILDLLVSCGVTDDDRHLRRIEMEWRDEGQGVVVEVRQT